MRLVRLFLWPVALVAGGATTVLILGADSADSPTLTATLGLVVGLSWCATGLEEWRRRPARRIGRLMVFFGLAWFASLWVYTSVSALYTVGQLVRPLFIAVLGHLLLAFPSGRLEGRLSRAIIAAAYIDTTLVVSASAVFLEPEAGDVRNLALIDANADLSDALRNVARGVGVVLILASLVVLARRWRGATLPWRRAAAPVLWVGAAAAAAGALRLINDGLDRPLGPVELAFFSILATVPLAFELGLLRSRLARSAVAELVVELGQTRRANVRDALARALHDPQLELAYWLPEQARYVDREGRPVELPGEDEAPATTIVEREGRRVAALVHDASLRDDPGLIDAVCAAAGLALENERLQAELRAHLDELRASRVRIVEAADAERRRLERDLHDGTQQRLVSVSMALGLAESKLASDPERARRILDETRKTLATALQELRELSQGIHPGILTERGLGAALQELAYSAPVPIELSIAPAERLPQPVEAAAYYVVAEALTNVAKYAAASSVSVSVERRNGRALVEVRDDGVGGADPARGSGLRGLADRVEALGGSLSLESPPGRGTRLNVEIPCES